MMPGPRKWTFTPKGSPSGTYTKETDFWVSYSLNDDATELIVTINEAWEQQIDAFNYADRYTARRAIENRMLTLLEMKGRRGTLVVDSGLTTPATYANILCENIDFSQNENNKMFEYTIDFSGFKRASSYGRGYTLTPYNNGREPVGTAVNVTADIMSVTYKKSDRTTFKDMFRNPPVRIFNGEPTTTITLSGIRQYIDDADAGTETQGLKRQRAKEAIDFALQSNVGKQFDLIIDPTSVDPVPSNLGRVHLQSVDLDTGSNYPDALSYSLTLISGYVE